MKSQYICQECGTIQPKWSGKCDACNSWNSFVEEIIEKVPKGLKGGKNTTIEFVSLQGHQTSLDRCCTGIAEFDRVCGGGLVPGSVILLGGDPGIGKSTLLLQMMADLAQTYSCSYISGEEAVDQIRLRAERLGVSQSAVALAGATNIGAIVAALEKLPSSSIVVIDSIQTMYIESLESAPGTVAQVRSSAQELMRVAKKRGIVLILVGHVTKEGTIAGPRVLEHMVDAVLYFEGEKGHQFRILRGVKNRYGPTDEIGVFEMTDQGVKEVANPSALFLADRQGEISGGAVFAGMEGTRPLLMEIQALVAPSSLATPRRAVVGWDPARLSMVIAVLEARCGIMMSGRDIYLNVTGGLKIAEPAADLAVAAALLSAWSNKPISRNSIFFGEIGLSGEIRPINHTGARLKESKKLGFEQAIIPFTKKPQPGVIEADFSNLSAIRHIAELVGIIQKDEI
jgi:DNA repair protein RadA/Sms